MIEVSRNTIRLFRAVLRKSVLADSPRGPCPAVLCRTDRRGLWLSCQGADVALLYQQAGVLPPHAIALPGRLLADLEGRTDTPVILEQNSPKEGRASWQDNGTPRLLEFEPEDVQKLKEPASVGQDSVTIPVGFLQALGEAARSTQHDSARYALKRMQLRGKEGSLVATDGHQLLIQKGYPFPWTDTLLIPALPVFCGRELSSYEPVRIGRSKEHVGIEVGPWLFSLRIDTSSRFPDVDRVIPSSNGASSRLHLDPDDASALLGALPRMPGREDPTAPITLELGRPITVRAKGEQGPAAEIVLGRSRYEGRAVQVVMDRRYLHRAIQLGFSTLTISKPEQPILCQEQARTYLWMPLSDKEAVAADKGPKVQLPSPSPPSRNPDHAQPRNSTPMPVNDNRPPEESRNAIQDGDQFDIVTEAEGLRTQLQQALASTSRLITALKQQRRQIRAMSAAMASLRRLREFAP